MPAVRQASRDDVLEVATRVFAERGFGNTSLRQLIAETGMSPTAFYARYPSKHAVLEALIERLLAQVLLQASTAFASAGGVDDAIAALSHQLATVFAPQKPVLRLMMTEAPVLPNVRRTLSAAYDAIARLVASYLVRIGTPNADALGWAMLGAIYVLLMRWAVFEELDDAGLLAALQTTVGLLRGAVR
jgi:AcrR family transcriptional regulator